MDSSYDRRNSYPARPPPNPPSSFYPRVGSDVGSSFARQPPNLPAQTAAAPGAGIGIKVALKPEYRVQPPVQLSPVTLEVPRTLFQFDFDFERRVLADAEKGWHSRQANGGEPAASVKIEDPVISKYVSMGFSKESVVLALANYGDVQDKVMEFCPAYSLLREMGFPSEAVAGALVMYDNDKERALAHFV